MGTITKWSVFWVLVVGLALTVPLGGIGPSPALGCDLTKGWMTGGGSIFFTTNGAEVQYGGQSGPSGRVTHGFVVHCTPRHSDSLEIVDHSTGFNFHLLELTQATCSDNPLIDPNPPGAAFDTFQGAGIGRCKMPSAKSWQPCYIEFIFTDAGEPGCLGDFADIKITAGSEPGGGVLLSIDGYVDCGNHQAHDGY